MRHLNEGNVPEQEDQKQEDGQSLPRCEKEGKDVTVQTGEGREQEADLQPIDDENE